MNIDFWTESEHQYGAFHRGDRSSNGFCRGLLIVFVHGIFGHPLKTWGDLPERILTESKIDADVLSFGYPTKFWHATSMHKAAVELLEVLHAQLGHVKHIVFVTHSTGGLILKESIILDIGRAIRRSQSNSAPYNSVALRIRRILNVAVPHCGGNRFLTTVAKWAYRSFYALSFLWLPQKIFSGKSTFGKNQIIEELSWKNEYLIQLENKYYSGIKYLQQSHLPRPISYELLASSDTAIHDYYEESDFEKEFEGLVVRSDSAKVVVRGSHSSVKLPKSKTKDHHMVNFIARFIGKYRMHLGDSLAEQPLEDCYQRTDHILRLIGQETNVEDEKREKTLPRFLRAGSQREIYEQLQTSLMRPANLEPEGLRLVITGSAGVGKSTLLRILAQELASKFFNDPDTNVDVPLFIHTPTLTPKIAQPGKDVDDKFLVQGFLNSLFVQWTNDLNADFFSRAEPLHPYLKKLRQQSIVLVLDSYDEFLANNPAFRLYHLRQALDAIDKFAKNPKLRIIVGIRSSVRNINQLASNDNCVLEIRPLSISEATEFFGNVKIWLDALSDKGHEKLFFTPLILTALSESNYTPNKESLKHPSNLLSLALTSILSKGKLNRVKNNSGLLTSHEEWISALSIVAATFHIELWQSTSLHELRDRVNLMADRWKVYLAEIYKGDAVEDFMRGFDLIFDNRTCSVLLRRTIFSVAPNNSYQFSHREWRDYLTARYLATSIEWSNVDELGQIAFNVPMYKTAGEILSSEALGEQIVRRALDRTKETGNQFIIGNLGALIGNSIAPITGPAIRLLFGGLKDLQPLSQIVTIGSPGRRALEVEDNSAADLREALNPVLLGLVKASKGKQVNTVVANLSWCFLKAYHIRFGTLKPPPRSSPLDIKRATLDDALAIVCRKSEGQWGYGTMEASVQQTFLDIQYSILTDPVTRPISVVHYLFCIVAARRRGLQIPEVTEELGQILAPNSDFDRIYRDFTDVPEVYELYTECQKIYAQLGSA